MSGFGGGETVESEGRACVAWMNSRSVVQISGTLLFHLE